MNENYKGGLKQIGAVWDKSTISEEKKYTFCKKVLEMESEARSLYLKMGEMLYNIREERLYEPSWESWDEYTLEFKDLSKSSVSKIISIYQTFILKYAVSPEKLQNIGWTKLYSLIPVSTTKKEAMEWIKKADVLTRSDIDKELLEAKNGIEMAKCFHSNAYIIKVCPDCGNKERIYENK